MAKYGARYVRFSPFAATNPEPDNALPRYGNKVSLGELQRVNDSFSAEEARQDGDDRLVEYLEEMTDFTVDVESAQLPFETERALYGLAGEGDLKYNVDSTPPWGGLAFVRSLMIHGVKKWQGIYYPKVKAAVQGEEDATKAKGMSFTGDKIHFVGTSAKNGCYKVKSELEDTAAAAQTWVDTQLAAAT